MYQPLTDDMNKRRMIAASLVRTHFAEPWQFRVEIDGMEAGLTKKDGSSHSVFDYLVKDVSFGPTEFQTEPVEAGANVFTFPTSAVPVVVTMTVRDTDDHQLYQWFNKWSGKVVNQDGTFSLPGTYIKKLTIFSYKDDADGSEKELWAGMVYPQKMGDIQKSVEAEGFTEFPVVFQQFRSLTIAKTSTDYPC